MSRTYDNERKPSQSIASVKSTALFLQTRGFAPLQTDLDEDAPRRSGYTENFLEKIINQHSPESSDTPIQAKPMNRLKAAKAQRMEIQAKLNIGKPNDKYEKEADDTASKVVQQINSPSQDKSVQKQEAMEEEDELQMKSLVQRRENLGGGEASTDLESSIQGARGSGQSLDAGLQSKMGQAMGADFSGVKVHTDSQSDQLNKSIQAKAFTTGQDVFFRQGAYEPSSRGGQELIAHELTHVVQQNGGTAMRSHLSSKKGQSIPTKSTPYALKVSNLHLTSQDVVTQRYFLGAATASSSATVLSGQDRQADNSFRDPLDPTHTQIATSGNDPTAGLTPLKISEKGKMAIENVNGNRQAKVFFAEGAIISKSNKELTKRGSAYLLQVAQANAITVTDQNGKSHALDEIEGVKNPDVGKASSPKKVAGQLATQNHGLALTVDATCVAVAEAIMGKSYGTTAKLLSVKMKKLGLLTATEQISWGAAIADAMTKQGKRKHGVLNETVVAQAYGLFLNNNPVAASKLAKKLKVNEFADPKVGQAFISESVGVPGGGIVNWLQDPTGNTRTKRMTPDPTVRGGMRRTGWGNHAGAVVAESGGDKITLENYARSGEDPALVDNDNIFYFAMYGPASKPTQTWHSVWSQSPTAPIANAVTGVFG